MNRTLGYLQASWRGVNRLAKTACDTAQRQLLALVEDAVPSPVREEAWEVIRDEDALSDSDPASEGDGSAARFRFDDPLLPDNGGLFDTEPVAGGYVLPDRDFESDVRSDVRSSSDDGEDSDGDEEDDNESCSDGEWYFDAREEVGGGSDSDGESFVDACSALCEESAAEELELELCASFEQSQVAGENAKGKAPDTERRQVVATPRTPYDMGGKDVKESRQHQQDRQPGQQERSPGESAHGVRRTDAPESSSAPGSRTAAHADYDVVDPKLKEKIAKVKQQRRGGNPSKS